MQKRLGGGGVEFVGECSAVDLLIAKRIRQILSTDTGLRLQHGMTDSKIKGTSTLAVVANTPPPRASRGSVSHEECVKFLQQARCGCHQILSNMVNQGTENRGEDVPFQGQQCTAK